PLLIYHLECVVEHCGWVYLAVSARTVAAGQGSGDGRGNLIPAGSNRQWAEVGVGLVVDLNCLDKRSDLLGQGALKVDERRLRGGGVEAGQSPRGERHWSGFLSPRCAGLAVGD